MSILKNNIKAYWFTGLSGVGKTTLAYALSKVLWQHNTTNKVLDGDELRKTISVDLGFSKADRDTHVIRVTELAYELQQHGITPIISLISPYAKMRTHAIKKLTALEIYLEAPLDILQQRDTKGLYAKALQGEIKLTGLGDPYEVPTSPNVWLRTDILSVNECINKILYQL
ncbi:adenylyl-sulfate kinase [Gammaproteobacteria bacterium ESL0073]|nr:adenylyl-sulfate kinase [Gammaproteobacteria bacterium ESL0073]